MLEKAASLSVLFVDDEEQISVNYTSFLVQKFQKVYRASDGEDAYRLYKQHMPNIMIVDINLPKMNGLELLKKIDINNVATEAIIMSAHTNIGEMLKEYGLKNIIYLGKPVQRKIFYQALEKAIAN